jgi:phosphoglycolate phosphatase
MSYRAALFDLDGTLLDTLDDLADSANAMLRTRGYPTHQVAAYRYFVGDGVASLIERIVPEEARTEANLAECATVYLDFYKENWNAKTSLYDGITEMLDGLAAKGVKLSVLSNKPDASTKRCVAEFLGQWDWAEVVGQRDGIPHKPDPAGAFDVAERMAIPPAEFLYLGDTATDMQTAVGSGMLAVGALWGFREADELTASGAAVLIEKPQELVGLAC